MRPRLIEFLQAYHLGDLAPNYTFMLTLALIVGAYLTVRQARRTGLPPEISSRAIVHTVLLLFPLARLVYAIQYWSEFKTDPWSLLDLRDGGIALYGGMAAVVLGPWLSLRRHPRLLLRYLDALTPALCLGLFLGRIGCFMAGCNWGAVSSVPWAVRFPGPHDAYAQHLRAGLIQYGDPLSLPVHPTQLYESGFGLAMLVLTSWWISRRYNRRAPVQAGRVFLVSVNAYALFRFFSEFVRADAFGWRPGVISMAQLCSLTVMAVSGLFFLRKNGPEYWNCASQKLSEWIHVCKRRDQDA